MTGLTLADIETELTHLAGRVYWDSEVEEKLLALARRIAVQIETDKLKAAA